MPPDSKPFVNQGIICLEDPCVKESGSSLRWRSRISKVVNRKLHNLLFLCSFTVFKHNKGCREVYEHIVNKGKSKKLTLISVSNELENRVLQ